jgi:hypothetical protein
MLEADRQVEGIQLVQLLLLFRLHLDDFLRRLLLVVVAGSEDGEGDQGQYAAHGLLLQP